MTRDARERGKDARQPRVSVRVPAAPTETSGAGSIPDDGAPLWGGRIRTGEELGRGAMGSVLRGTDTKLRREIALKVTSVPRTELPIELLARFVEEAQVTAQLEHPNIVPIHDLGVDPEGRAYYSMKLIRGESLESLLEKRKSSADPETLGEIGLRRLLDIFLDVCQAVAYAHARGVIHRDLKPANIMVGDFGEVLVMDWGVAKLTDRAARQPSTDDEPTSTSVVVDVDSVRSSNAAFATQHGAILGTPAYMAPEQAQSKDVDERADVYSLGVILYEILCGEVPFDSDDPGVLFARLFEEKPRPPSRIDPSTPLALEALALRLLEKKPEHRDLTIGQIRSHVQDYIEGIGREHRQDSVWTNLLWLAGALGLFAFLVPYWTGQSIAALIALTPRAVFSAVGWFLVVIALRYPLWAAVTSLRVSRSPSDRFRAETSEERFVSAFLAHRTLATTITPLFLLVFVADAFATVRASRGAMNAEIVGRIVTQLRAEWANALTCIILFLFGYLYCQSTEARFARRTDRYVTLVRRPKWESIWPVVLMVVVVATLVATDVVDFMGSGHGSFLRERVLAKRVGLFEIGESLVFQATFLFGLVATALVMAFPVPELLAAFRIAYQPVDGAWVSTRRRYFLRSMAVFQIAKSCWLYAGVMMGCLTAVTLLTQRSEKPLAAQLLSVLGPSLIGFLGFQLTRRYVIDHLANAPAVRKMLKAQTALAETEHDEATLEQLRAVSWRTRALQVSVPVLCVVGYLVWTGSGVHQQAIRKLIIPASMNGWLLILPYALLAVLVLFRDLIQIWVLHRRVERAKLDSVG
jgi:tRNA A-37 threonylcarbamoyl transferase component Bud32